MTIDELEHYGVWVPADKLAEYREEQEQKEFDKGWDEGFKECGELKDEEYAALEKEYATIADRLESFERSQNDNYYKEW